MVISVVDSREADAGFNDRNKYIANETNRNYIQSFFFFYILNIGYNFHQDVTLVYFIVNFRLKTHIVYVIASSSLNKISFP